MSPAKKKTATEGDAARARKFGWCEGTKADGAPCGGTEFVCRMYGRDSGRPCCPNCTHKNGWKPDQ